MNTNTSIRVINFGFAYTVEQRAELAALIGVNEGDLDITEMKPQFSLPAQFIADQVKALVEAANVPRNGSQRLVIDMPGMSWASVCVLAAIQGLYGSLPEMVRRVQDESKTFHVQEIVGLQTLRDEGRKARYDGREGLSFGEETQVVINFSHPLTESQVASLWFKPEIIQVPTQVDTKSNFAEAAVQLVDAAGLSSAQWQRSSNIIVNAPALAPLAAAVLTEINARMGVFPRIIRLDRQADNSYVFAEFIEVHSLREWAHGFDAAKAEAARREIMKEYLSAQPMGCIDEKTGELVLISGGKTFRLMVSQVTVEEGVPYKAAEAITDRWLKSFEPVAQAQGLNFYPPGVANGLFAGFMANALATGALWFNTAPVVKPTEPKSE